MRNLSRQLDLNHLYASPKIALLYFGIIRSIRYTSASHTQYVHGVFGQISNLNIYGHFINQDSINSVRTGEKCVVDRQSVGLLGLKKPVLLDNHELTAEQNLSSISVYGDIAWDQHLTTKNLIKQLISLESSANWALNNNYNIAVFLRTDLIFHDSILNGLSMNELRSDNNAPRVYLPYWERWGGHNDRFAICIGAEAIRAYGKRIQLVREYCLENCCPLHAEKLLRYSLDFAKVPVFPLKVRASRVRETGEIVNENFTESQGTWEYERFRMLRFARKTRNAFTS